MTGARYPPGCRVGHRPPDRAGTNGSPVDHVVLNGATLCGLSADGGWVTHHGIPTCPPCALTLSLNPGLVEFVPGTTLGDTIRQIAELGAAAIERGEQPPESYMLLLDILRGAKDAAASENNRRQP